VKVKNHSNTMYINMCIFTSTYSQKHNNLSDGITTQYATLRNIQLHVSALKVGHHQVVRRTSKLTIQ